MDRLVRAAKGADKALVKDVRVFDVYTGDRVEAGRKSVAISVTIQPSDRTLTEDDIDSLGQRLIAAVGKATGASLRS